LNAEAPIGIFDSGIGGLTVAHAINKVLPNEKIIYFGDTQHLPYGNKSIEKIQKYSITIIDFLLKKQCKAIIIACNSASAVAYQKIIKKVENQALIFNVIHPVINYINSQTHIQHVGVIGTNATISSDIYRTHINTLRKDITVSSLATPLLASLIEEDNKILYQKGIVESYLENHKLKNIDSLILGCTHYPLIEKQINHFYDKKVEIISAIKYIGHSVKKMLKQNNLLNQKNTKHKHYFYVSDYTENFQKKTKLFFPKSIILEQENIFS
tara:strand:- start:20 stop:826 length:807 start_codon:yes stop_codon:yes gene_type:complete